MFSASLWAGKKYESAATRLATGTGAGTDAVADDAAGADIAAV